MGTINNRPPILSAIPCAATTWLPKLPRIRVDPLNMPISKKLLRPNGIPPLRMSLITLNEGQSKREKNSVDL